MREAIAKGTINADDEDALIQLKQCISPIKADTVEIIDSDDEEALSQMKEARKEKLRKARETKAKKQPIKQHVVVNALNFRPVCTSTQTNSPQSFRKSNPWDYGAGYMDETIDMLGRPFIWDMVLMLKMKYS